MSQRSDLDQPRRIVLPADLPQPSRAADLGRRAFLSGALAGTLGLAFPGAWAAAVEGCFSCCSGEDPMHCIRHHRFDVMAAFFEAQMCCLWDGPPGDSAEEVALDAADYVRYLTPKYQEGLCGILSWLEFRSLTHTRRRFSRLSVDERWALLNQGEMPQPRRFLRRPLPIIRWEEDFPLHSAVSSLALLGRLVINSRRPARVYIGCDWSRPCSEPENLVRIETPEYPDLDQEYDVCVIGSGAGGAVVAARAAAAGKRVLMIEMGKWISPDALVERELDERGQLTIAPPRSDVVLKELYRNGGVQLAGELGQLMQNKLELLLPGSRRQMPPRQSILVLQPQVVGGGPQVNNAIHLEMEEKAWARWPVHPAGVAFADVWQRMQSIKDQLGVNVVATARSAGLRGLRFADGAQLAGDPALLTPVSIIEECNGCGADNSLDPFGMHTGGLHPHRPDGPNSFLMQAVKAEVPADVAYQTQAMQLQFQTHKDGTVAVRQLVVEDRRGCEPNCPGQVRHVRARQFVLCAGVAASTKLLAGSLASHGLEVNGLGEGLNGNVGAAVVAVYDKPIYEGESERPEPGITQCFFVREREVQDPDGSLHKEPVLENWFHFPGTVALALTGWFHEFGKVIRKYNHMATAGMVVPTSVRPENRVNPDGTMMLKLNEEEFELLCRGILRIGRIFLAATEPDNGATLYLPTKAVMLDDCGQPLEIRTEEQLVAAVNAIRCRGPEFINLVTSHPQGGNALGKVVDETTFRLKLAGGEQVQNLYVADASIFPAGCEVNPQLTLTALASYAADSMLSRAEA